MSLGDVAHLAVSLCSLTPLLCFTKITYFINKTLSDGVGLQFGRSRVQISTRIVAAQLSVFLSNVTNFTSKCGYEYPIPTVARERAVVPNPLSRVVPWRFFSHSLSIVSNYDSIQVVHKTLKLQLVLMGHFATSQFAG